MANTYRWYINSLETYPTFDGYDLFVTKVNWRYNATNENGVTSNIEGMTTFNSVNDTIEHPYVLYTNLTENEVTEWLDEYNDIISLREKLDILIDEQVNPVIVTLPLPWE